MAIRKLLVANRGEVAARVFRTCDRLEIETVAVAAPDDLGAFHTRRAVHVRDVGSYLSKDDMISAALESGADAIHPGYGFLAEQAEFAEAVTAAGLTWVGPPAEAMRLAANKLAAKCAAEGAGVPIVPSGSPDDIGYPLILKAAAGGGGRGMRVVRSQDTLDEALEAARREAGAAFGDDTVFAERLIEGARHVEVQLLADHGGNVAAVGTRDCSIQRRHQKVLEEGPAPEPSPAVARDLCDAAEAIGRAVNYENAGTVEFLVSESGFCFIELNARLQVEHPVTEAVTGLDLVDEQLRLAVGDPLGALPPEHGHAVEARLYAEHPATFLPQAGIVERLELPGIIRVDAGVEAGDAVPIAYDPLIAKLVSRAETREAALDELARALAETRIEGVTTNIALLRWLLRHPAIREGTATTAFFDDHRPFSGTHSPPSPWLGGWRLNGPLPRRLPPPSLAGAGSSQGRGAESSEIRAPMSGRVIRVLVARGDTVTDRQPILVLEAMKMETPVTAPFAGTVGRVAVEPGDQVAGGSLLAEIAT